AVLAARIDRLAEGERALLQTAALIGKEFPRAVLERVAGLAPDDLSAALAGLERAEFIFERTLYPDAEYGFRHPLTQEGARHSRTPPSRPKRHRCGSRRAAGCSAPTGGSGARKSTPSSPKVGRSPSRPVTCDYSRSSSACTEARRAPLAICGRTTSTPQKRCI